VSVISLNTIKDILQNCDVISFPITFVLHIEQLKRTVSQRLKNKTCYLLFDDQRKDQRTEHFEM
jgi:hypothetical protein